jgi:PhoPQ-activated pathogenicity-related protein
MRILLALMILGMLTTQIPAAEPDGHLSNSLSKYLLAEDPSYQWKLMKTDDMNGTKVYTIALVSQTWHEVKWEHDLQVVIPKGMKPQATMVLWNQGGTATAPNTAFALLLAEKVGAPIAFLYGVPKQPLYIDKSSGKLTTVPTDPTDPKVGRLVEDALIAETFVRFLATKDATWPLLYPMVKSVVRAMDALQAFAKDEMKTEVKQFVITGASKRGWTSWLTAASGDKRVKAIAPLVIDTLNFPVQMKNQVAAFGQPSEMIADYTRAKLVPIPDTTEGKALWQMVDPYMYKDVITVPKMMINGTNDPYWPQDALNTYWDELKGEKYVCYVPNAGHNLREKDKDGKEELIPLRAVNTLAAFSRCQIFNAKMPKLECKWDDSKMSCVTTGTGIVTAIREWEATSNTRDFRQSRWQEKSTVKPGSRNNPPSFTLVGKAPEKGSVAKFVEYEFETDNGPLHLCTQINIAESK